MNLNPNIILAVDALITNLGLSIPEYIAAKISATQNAVNAAKLKNNSEKSDSDAYLSRKEAAEFLRCSTDTIDDLARAGKIRRVKLASARCGHVLIEKKSLLNFLRSSMISSKNKHFFQEESQK